MTCLDLRDVFFSQGRRASAFRCSVPGFAEAQKAAESCRVQLHREPPATSRCADWSGRDRLQISVWFFFPLHLSPCFICSLSFLCQVPADLWKVYIDIKMLKPPPVANSCTCCLGCAWFSPWGSLRSKLEACLQRVPYYITVSPWSRQMAPQQLLLTEEEQDLPGLLLTLPSVVTHVQATGFPAWGIHLISSASPFLGMARGMFSGLYRAAYSAGPHFALGVWWIVSANLMALRSTARRWGRIRAYTFR